MPAPLMPKATAIWLVENTTLTFKQIADFCDMHELEVQAIADGEAGHGIIGADPIHNGQVTKEEIVRCEQDAKTSLKLNEIKASKITGRKKDSATGVKKYTPISRRQDRPDAIAWIIRHHPEFSDAQVCRLLRTTKPTIDAIRNRTHRNITEITPKNPVTLGLCTELELDKIIKKANKKK